MNAGKPARRALALAFLLLGAICLALAGVSFHRKLVSFQPLGFRAAAGADHLRVVSVEDSTTGLAAGDRILLVDGQAATSGAQAIERHLRDQESAHLVILRGEQLIETDYRRPPIALDLPYLVLAFLGLVYFGIGLFALWRTPQGQLFFLWALASAVVYVFSPVYPLDALGKLLYLVEAAARGLLPPLALHLFLAIPGVPARHSRIRRLLPWAYLPGALLFAANLDLAAAHGKLWIGPPTAATIRALDRLDLAHIALFTVLAAAGLVVGLRQVAEWESRRQMQWLAVGAVAGYLPFAALYLLPTVVGVHWPPVVVVLSVLPLAFVPVAFSWALLRYRLFDLGVMVRDGLSYGLTLFVGLGSFALLDLFIRRVLPESWGLSRDAASFAAGLGIAALVVPAQRRVSSVFERLQYGAAFRRRRALAQLGRELLHERDLDRLARVLVAELADALELDRVELLLSRGGRLEAAFAGSRSTPAIDLADLPPGIWSTPHRAIFPVDGFPGDRTAFRRLAENGVRYLFPLVVRQKPIGLLLVGPKGSGVPLNSEDLDLVRSLLDQAALAVENAQLLDQVQHQLEQVTDLQRHNERIIESSPAGIAVIDESAHIRQVNEAFAALVERSVAGLVGLPIGDILPVTGIPAPGSPSWQVEWSAPDGEVRHLQVGVAAMRSSDGPGGRILVVQDVSDRVKMEAALKEQDRLAAIGLLAAGVAHEVNTPLTGISSYAQLLLADTPEGDPRRELLQKVERQTFRAARIVNGLLDFARQRGGEKGLLEVGAVIGDCADLLRERFSRRGIRFRYDAPAEPIHALGNEGELQQVVTNLLLNAVDAMPGGGSLVVELSADATMAQLVVTDSGHGVPPELLDKIFQPFFTTKAGQGGTGLGLAISQQIVAQHSGRIGVDSRPGEGTRFTVVLPRQEPPGTPPAS